MRRKRVFLGAFILLACGTATMQAQVLTLDGDGAQNPEPARIQAGTVEDLKALLEERTASSDNPWFRNHCRSMLEVIESKSRLTAQDSLFLGDVLRAFTDPSVQWNAGEWSSYLQRKRPFIFAWTSATDGAVSLAWLIPPENWDPARAYPLYVRLHGLSAIYANPIEFMTRYLRPGAPYEGTFEDGYTLLPWARGNLWYQGIAETDVFEGIGALEAFARVEPGRKYIVGFSMGGYGSWAIGQKTPETWAAVGVFAGALWYGGGGMLTPPAADRLRNTPVYFVCGLNDGLLGNNKTAYEMLRATGNPDCVLNTFPGGHEAPLEEWRNLYDWIRNYSRAPGGTVNRPDPAVSLRIALIGNYPNPFNPETTIRYSLARRSKAEIALFDAAGRRIRTLLDGTVPPGEGEIRWDGRDDAGAEVPSGMCVCRLRAGGAAASRKMLLLR